MENKKKKVLLILMCVLLVVIIAAVGVFVYVKTHVFVEKTPYPISAESLDLRQEEISFDHYDSLHAQLPDCYVVWNVPFQGGKLSSDVETVTLTELTKDDILVLANYFGSLRTVDATGCSDYTMLEALCKAIPQLDVQYTVSLGQKSVDPDVTELELLEGEYDYDTLTGNLKHLPQLTALHLKMPKLTLEQIDALREAYPKLEIRCTVEILGTEYEMDTEELDLSAMTAEQVTEISEKLKMLPKLAAVELNDTEGKSKLAMEDVKALMEAVPQVKFHYTFDFYGVPITTTDEEVIIRNKKIGEEGVDNVRLALDLMQDCKRFVMEYCQIPNETMSQLREEYRDKTKIVWRIFFGKGTSLTDAEILRSTYNVDDDNCHDLIYLEDVRYMDIGHNEYLDAVPFVAGMKSLEVVIVSGAPIKDLTPFENSPNLRILEISNCMYVKDVGPLAKCEKLEMLNMAYTSVTDLSPLDDLELTYLMAVHNKVPVEEENRFVEKHPDCVTTFSGTSQPYGHGWRYDANDKPLPWYADITEVFGYPNPYNDVGWYLKKD